MTEGRAALGLKASSGGSVTCHLLRARWASPHPSGTVDPPEHDWRQKRQHSSRPAELGRDAAMNLAICLCSGSGSQASVPAFGGFSVHGISFRDQPDSTVTRVSHWARRQPGAAAWMSCRTADPGHGLPVLCPGLSGPCYAQFQPSLPLRAPSRNSTQQFPLSSGSQSPLAPRARAGSAGELTAGSSTQPTRQELAVKDPSALDSQVGPI